MKNQLLNLLSEIGADRINFRVGQSKTGETVVNISIQGLVCRKPGSHIFLDAPAAHGSTFDAAIDMLANELIEQEIKLDYTKTRPKLYKSA